jgi:hypothetical protein
VVIWCDVDESIEAMIQTKYWGIYLSDILVIRRVRSTLSNAEAKSSRITCFLRRRLTGILFWRSAWQFCIAC